MGRELQRLKRRKATVQKMDDLLDQASTSLVIHYSCESFYGKTDGRTPRVTSIAVRNLRSGQTDSFSIHQIAEVRGVSFNEIDKHYDSLEKAMLDRFFDFVQSRQHFNWIHWNMRDVNYGFYAIEHRFRVLGGTPIQIAEDRKFDLARALVDLYGIRYIEHPRFEKIASKNKISQKDFLSGHEEAKAFETKEFIKLHQSTLRKVDTLAGIFERTQNKSLKTNSSWLQRHGYTMEAVAEWTKEHWLLSILTAGGVIIAFVFDVFKILKTLYEMIN